ncbi:hypothetical protein QCA50_018686 [Cerrena zonata]|uniref:Anaphase-promoting complex subunit 4 WD40 domain-containing protein n=1 Tax=Cerrena zonata TaxID=2478898 RepID=A0AAW0FAM1_9APHY
MSYKANHIYPCNPATARGTSTKLSAHKDKIVYTNGRTVIIRDLKNPGSVIANAGHVHNATVAKISPTGYYCASADITGTVRIWDIVGEDQALKGEYKALAGRINDLEWDGESKRIIAVGEGRDKFGHAFMYDSGSSTGEIMGHNKVINAVSIRHQRPFRAATGGDDTTIVFHQGAPYKYVKTLKTHTKFVQDIKYAPSGNHFVSVGSDAKIFLYDGKEGDSLGEFTESPHSGTITAVSWNPESNSITTSSADGTVKLWDVESRKATSTWTLGSGVDYHQVGVVWTGGDEIVSVSLFGDLNVFDKRVGDKPSRILHAPTKGITTALSPPNTTNTFIAGTADGRVLSHSGEAYEYASGQSHTAYVSSLTATSDGQQIFSAGYDDRVREIDPQGLQFVPAIFSASSQPRSLATTSDSAIVIAENSSIEVIKSNQKVFDIASPKFTPSSAAASGSTVAVGGEDMKVRLYDWDGKTLKEGGILENNKGVVSALAFSPDGAWLAAGDSTGRIVLYDVKEKSMKTARWSFHTARVNSLVWTADGKHVASGSLDTHIYIWSLQNPIKNIAIKNAAPGGVNGVFWVGEGKLGSAGADGCVKLWDVTFHQ